MKILILVLVLLPIAGFAQMKYKQNTEDVMYLKNGSVLRGKVVDSSRDTVVRIQILGGSIFAHGVSEIDTLVRSQQIETQEYNYYATGYEQIKERLDMSKMRGTWYHHTTMKLSAGFNSGTPVGVFGLAHSSGYYLGSWLGVGLGAGIERNAGYNIVPVYANVRGFFTKTLNTFYYSVDVGYNLPIKQAQRPDVWWRTMTDARGGLYLHPALGVRFYSGSKAAFTMDFGYVVQRVDYTFQDQWNPEFPYTERNLWIRPALRFGMLF